MLTLSGENDDLFEAIKSGASGYLLKTQDTEDFFTRLLELSRGEVPLSPGLAVRVLDLFGGQARLLEGQADAEKGAPEDSPLTGREREVLTLVAQGLTYKEVAAQLCLSERTIKYHMGEIIARLHLDNRAQVVEYAKRTKII
jgi:DNA-binding NarL/FixJ family response regulator